MAFTQKHIDAIDEAIATGELEVNFGDRKVKYRSIAELKTAKRHIVGQIRGTTKSSSSIKTYRINVSKL
mgnify:CR=1 FL=1